MMALREVSTKDLVGELKRRRWQGVDFLNVNADEVYQIEVGRKSFLNEVPFLRRLGVIRQSGPAVLLMVVD